jgi:hypothetical protein
MKQDTSPVTITGMICYRVNDTRWSRPGTVWGPLRWKNGALQAQVRMVDTDRKRWVPTAELAFYSGTADRLRAEYPLRHPADSRRLARARRALAAV